ncbi:MAG: hypothetical protein JKY54_17405 [Flavobacteriales bacterium]|nr:hypothetical protein [Flavobacteriales bacterium]
MKIEFKNAKSSDVVDALTGGPIQGEAVRCTRCNCFYGNESIEALKEHNENCCVSCGHTDFAIEAENK